jgi:hypothetical protein
MEPECSLPQSQEPTTCPYHLGEQTAEKEMVETCDIFDLK